MRGRGFTLLELTIALAIFALLSVMAYGGLQTVLQSRAGSTAMATRLAALQMSMSILARDLEQAVARGIRDEFGDRRPALAGGTGPVLLELTRIAPALPGATGSDLARVGYALREGRLVRLAWAVLDRAQDSEPRPFVLLEDVQRVSVRFLDTEGEWHTEWPALRGAAASAILPLAVEVNLELEHWGSLSRLYRLPG